MHGLLLPMTMAAITLGVALMVAPLALSWPRRVRWLVVMQAMDRPWPGIGPSGVDLREVVVVSVETGTEPVIRVHERGHAPEQIVSLACPAPLGDEQLRLLADWGSLRTPLALFGASTTAATLAGPTVAFSGLRVAGAALPRDPSPRP